jgi:imidazolonepropionase-like amidohydrolase
MADRILIDAPHLLDVVGGRWLADRRILVADERIEAILAPGDAAPADARPLAIGGDWVVPGLIDCHAHLIGELEYSGIPAVDVTPAQEAMSGVRNARDTVRAGFTTVRDVGTFWAFVDVALRDAIDRGWTPGPRMQCAGAYVTCPGGGGEVTGEAPSMGLPDGLRMGVVRDEAEVRSTVRMLIAGGADLIKCIVTGAVLTRGTDPGAVELSEAMVRAAVEEAAAHGRSVAAHAHGTEGIKVAIRAGVRSIEHASLIDDEGIGMLVEHGTYLVADVYDGDWINEVGVRDGWPAETLAKNVLTTEAQRVAFGKAVAAGVRIAYGTDSGVYPHPMVAIQLGYQVRLGQTPLQALRSATLTAAELMGWEDRVGSLRPGRFADLVASTADPLEDIEVLRRPATVVKGGSRVD